MSRLKLKRFSMDPLMEEYTKSGEKWIKLNEVEELEPMMGFLNNHGSNIGLADMWLVDNDHYVVKLHGGLNGPGKWEDYLYDIGNIIKVLPGSYIIRLETDVLDDVWDLYIGVPKNK